MPTRRRALSGIAAAAAWITTGGSVAASDPAGGATSAGTEKQERKAPARDTASAPGGGTVRARVLGIAQDGGLPHLGCRRTCCAAARLDPARARRVASLGIFSSSSGRAVLVDATPDIRSQAEDLIEASGAEPEPGRLLDGILITHAHVGHYTGLLHLGREAMATRAQPVLATPRTCEFLRSNKPWSRLVEWGHVELRALRPSEPVDLGGGLRITPLGVPHRDEDSDTVGYLLDGGSRRLLYVPDTDAWERWPRSLESILADVDVAILDGTFFDGGEVPGRDPAEIPHPLIRRTMDRLGDRSTSNGPRILFTHLNHTNPALDARSVAAGEILRRGYEVAVEGMEMAL